METTWTTCRPNGRNLAIWFLATSGVSAILVACFIWFSIQESILLLGAMSLIIAFCGAVLMRVRFRYDDKQIQSRYFRNTKRSWDDVAGWSLLSTHRMHLYIRFSDGVTVGSNQWVLNEQQIEELIPLLLAKIGEPKKAENTILPWPYRALIAIPPCAPNNTE